jgi:hypothetical protein
MPCVTSIEELGRREGRQEDILEILGTRFGDIPYELREEIHSLRDDAALQRALRTAIVSASLATFREQLRATPG